MPNFGASRSSLPSALALAWLLVLSTLLSACGGSSSQAKSAAPQMPDALMKWGFQTGGVSLAIKADESLNLYDEEPHTIVLCIYQLSDPSKFDEASKTPEGALGLYSCSRFDPSVVGVSRHIIQPGENKPITLDRAENARFVGVTAGYYVVSPARAVRLFPIPVSEHTEGWIFKDTTRQPGQFAVSLLLGPREIQEIGSK